MRKATKLMNGIKKELKETHSMDVDRKTQYYCQDVSFPQYYRSDAISIKIPAGYFVGIDKLTLKCIW